MKKEYWIIGIIILGFLWYKEKKEKLSASTNQNSPCN